MKQTIIGRNKEQKKLEGMYSSTDPQFLAVYGRRRIGKTFLISEFFKGKGIYFEITGIKDGSINEQLFQFIYEFSRKFTKESAISSLKSWAEAFQLLHGAIEKIPKEEKIILFFDEVPWMASRRSKFLNALEHFWNRYLSRRKNSILVICGSSASWIIRNIINNKGGLYGRITAKMCLLPFTLSETEEYLHSRGIKLDRKQVIDLYMAIGGVPKYLSYASKGKSATQIINDLCFLKEGELRGEFENLYKSLFDNYDCHVSIVKALSKHPRGLQKGELLKKVNLSSGGTSSKIIQELIDAGFLICLPSFLKKKKLGVYRLIDEYSLFYLSWIFPESKASLDGGDESLWIKKRNTPKGLVWGGLAFETTCLKHVGKIKKALGISGILTTESTWHYLPSQSEKKQGAQIDLVIDRDDRCIHLCEMKYSDSEFVINKEYQEKLERKKRVFQEETKTKKTLFTTIITTYGAKKNSHFLSVIDQQLKMDILF